MSIASLEVVNHKRHERVALTSFRGNDVKYYLDKFPVILPGINKQTMLFPSRYNTCQQTFCKSPRAFILPLNQEFGSVLAGIEREESRADSKLTVDVKEAAKLLGIGLNNTYDLVRSGRLKSVKVGKRVIIPKTEIEAFLNRELN